MVVKAFSSERPSEILYATRSTIEADVWLRKNIEETEDGYCADEVHIITTAAREEIEKDFEKYFKIGENSNQTDKERIAALENENAELREQLEATMAAVDFILFGEV